MASDEEIQYQRIRELILANEPDCEYEFELRSTMYDQLRAELGKDNADDSYPRLLYDWTRQVVTIVTAPTYLHEDTSMSIITSLSNRVQSLLEREGIRVGAGQGLGWSASPKQMIKHGHLHYEMEPDGVIFFDTLDAREFKVVIEVGVSQSNDSLVEKARKWLYGQQCEIVLLQNTIENNHVAQMRRGWLSPSFSQFGPLEFGGHIWLNEISEAFVEVVRRAPDSDGIDSLTSMKYVLIDEGRDESSSVPASVGDIRLGECIPPDILGSDAAANIVVDFFNSDRFFMDIVRRAMVGTAINRFQRVVRSTH
ncbi:hypothetical protein V1509DRAFT_638901 [Lipomyces kononenkoae]